MFSFIFDEQLPLHYDMNKSVAAVNTAKFIFRRAVERLIILIALIARLIILIAR